MNLPACQRLSDDLYLNINYEEAMSGGKTKMKAMAGRYISIAII